MSQTVPPNNAECDAWLKAAAAHMSSVKPDIFDGFNLSQAFYESAGVHIGTDVLVPKDVDLAKPRPVIVRIHGGFLVTGSSLFPAWFPRWLLDFAQETGAVIVSPDYRLLPEVKGRDILNDLEAFWRWVLGGGPQGHLGSKGQSQLSLDLDRLLLVGDSAGGYLAVQSAFLGFARPRAIIAAYPMLDVTSDYYNKPGEKPLLGAPHFPNTVVDSFMESRAGVPAVTAADPPERIDLATSIAQNGRYTEFLGDEPELAPLERLRDGTLRPGPNGEALLAPLYILHGRDDTVVPVGWSVDFLKLLKEVDGKARVHAVFRDGEHGFDSTASTRDAWMREGLEFVLGPWLG